MLELSSPFSRSQLGKKRRRNLETKLHVVLRFKYLVLFVSVIVGAMRNMRLALVRPSPDS